MKAAVDLHIHSALSPCSDNEMTPNNIVNMAYLKGLDVIAVTDHNSAENLPAIMKCAKQRGIVIVPGMELETSEEVHLACLMPDIAAVFRLQEKVYEALPGLENREDIFGPQLVMDENDEIVSHNKRMLITATSIGVDVAVQMIEQLGGVALPAHVDRESYSMISNLGFVPEHLELTWIEISKNCDREKLLKGHPELGKYKMLRSSDAHRLGDMLEREFFLDLEELSVQCVLKALKGN